MNNLPKFNVVEIDHIAMEQNEHNRMKNVVYEYRNPVEIKYQTNLIGDALQKLLEYVHGAKFGEDKSIIRRALNKHTYEIIDRTSYTFSKENRLLKTCMIKCTDPKMEEKLLKEVELVSGQV